MSEQSGNGRRVPAVQSVDQSAAPSIRPLVGRGEHIVLVALPGRFASLRRKEDLFAEGVHTIFGVTGLEAEFVAFCFPARQFTPGAARQWLQDRDLPVLLFTEASDSAEDGHGARR